MTAATESIRQALTEECPLQWAVTESAPGVLELRAVDFPSPHGLTVRVEFGAHVSTCSINFDAFSAQIASPVRAAFEDFMRSGAELKSTSSWESRVGVQLRNSPDAVGALVCADDESVFVGKVPIHVFDVLSAAGRILAAGFVEEYPSNGIGPDDTLEIGFPEGARATVEVNRFERDPRNRARAIKIHGSDCMVCGMNFGKEFGPLAEGYIHIHHTVPISHLGPDYSIDPVKDLVPLCANCHAAAHRRNPPLSVEELRNLRDR